MNMGEFSKRFALYNKLLPLAREAVTRAVPSALSAGLLPLFTDRFAAGKAGPVPRWKCPPDCHVSFSVSLGSLILHGLQLCGSLHRSFTVPFDQCDLQAVDTPLEVERVCAAPSHCPTHSLKHLRGHFGPINSIVNKSRSSHCSESLSFA